MFLTFIYRKNRGRIQNSAKRILNHGAVRMSRRVKRTALLEVKKKKKKSVTNMKSTSLGQRGNFHYCDRSNHSRIYIV